MSFCSTNWSMSFVCCASKSDLISTTKCDQILNLIPPKAGAEHEFLFHKSTSVSHMMQHHIPVAWAEPKSQYKQTS
jgi:hypothetical protein